MHRRITSESIGKSNAATFNKRIHEDRMMFQTMRKVVSTTKWLLMTAHMLSNGVTFNFELTEELETFH